MSQYMFGTGQLYGMPVGGGDPLQFGALQDVSIDLTSDIKQLFGQYQFPLSVARGKTKIEGKAMTGQVDPDIYENLYFGSGDSEATGASIPIFLEAATIPATPGPYTVTVANAATFTMDLRVVFASTGVRLKQVPSAPAAGQYTVAAGVYTFNATDQGKAILINYIYTDAARGNTITINNQLMGVAPTFQLVLTETFDNKTFVFVLYKCTSSKLTFPFKQDDYALSEIDFQAQANDAGVIGFLSASLT